MPKHLTTRSWTDDQNARLLALAAEGATPIRAAAAMGRSKHSVVKQARVLGVKFRPLQDTPRAPAHERI
ncbi:MAG: hypothetical protein BGN84_09980 [Afipia sp. 62-7]|nr:MAG: hypothetical protein BGN84_09980 [Afipia sp. 62-7]